MKDTRQPLPAGTKIGVDSGSIYEISGDPIGFGGGSIIYPAVRYTRRDGEKSTDGFDYVLKECFPAPGAHRFVRGATGERIPENGDSGGADYLRLCKSMQLSEEAITKSLYKTAVHTLPIKESAQCAECVLPGQPGRTIENVFTVMDSLSLKGNALTSYVKNRRMLPLRQAFSVVQQLLYAVREIHNAGFLHLDIQTGNIFIQGSLAPGESILTLIDFGCARALKDGRTDVISDRLVFTTQGFAAPEILLHNDGSLVLTPAADIYSVGCVLLNLLTGKRYDSAELISNKRGKYIDAMKLYRINCPRHLTEKMQLIIAKALKNEPSERYNTADEMLRDVEDFINALPLTVTPLANTAFSAFISYRHGDIDSRAAQELQKQLEHFHAPKGISAERKPFKRCYLDDGELSGGYDYAKQLREALKNSEWLIVVSSPGTKDSRWVNEEIDIFLEYHDRSRVLALLTGGEPEQSFPPRLLEETPAGDLLIAADCRGDDLGQVLKNIRGDAFLRLAAPMLSTTFDGLKQRNRIYRLRRVAAAGAAVAVLAVSFGVYSADKAATIASQAARIEAEYKNALINESRFLTEQAKNYLAEEDTIGAIEMALRALPSETQDRPVLADAKYVLGSALDVYVMPGHEKPFKATKSFASDKVYKMFCDTEGEYIFTLEDEYKRVCVRDGNFDLIDAVRFDEEISSQFFSLELLIPGKSSLLVSTYSGVFCWNYETGELSTLTDEHASGIMLSADGSFAAIITSEYTDAFETNYYVTLIDTETGALLGKHELNAAVKALCDADISLYYFNYVLDLLAIEPDGSGLVFAVSDSPIYLPEAPVSRLFYLDLVSGDIRRLCTVPDYVYEMNMIGSYLTFCTSYDTMLSTDAGTVDHSDQIALYVYDLDKNEVVNCIEESKYGVGYEYRIEPIYYRDGEFDTDAAVFIAGNYCEAIELSTGKVLKKYDFGSPIVKSICREDGITAILRNGNVASVDYSDPRVPGQSRFFCEDIKDVCFSGGYVYVLTTDRVLRYETGAYDKGYMSLDTAPDVTGNDPFLYEPDRAESRFYLLKDDVLYITDTRKNECSHAALPFAGDEYDESTLLGTSPDGRCFYVKRSPYQYDWEAEAGQLVGSEYYIVSLQDGSVSVSAEVIKAESGISVIDSFYYNGALYYAADAEDGGSILLYSWIPGEERAEKLGSYDVPDGYSFFQASLKADSECVCFALRGDADNGCILVGFDAADKKFLTTDDNGEMPTQFIRDAYLWDVSRGAAIYMLCTTQSDGTEDVSLHISDVDGGHVIAKLPSVYGADDIRMLAQSPDGRLFAVMSDSVIEYSYTGEILNEVELETALVGLGLYSEETACQFMDDNAVALSSSRVTVILDLTDDSLEAEAYVPFGLGYDAAGNRVIVFDAYAAEDAESPLGSFHRYSTAELTAMGEAVLG